MTKSVVRVRQIQKTLKASLGNLAGNRRAIMFSGGFDSMLMTLLAQRYGARVSAVTVRFEDFNPRTVTQAAVLARRMGLPHHILHVTLPEFLSAFRSVKSLIRKPITDLDLVLVYAALKKYDPTTGGKIFTSGMGSDQWFGDKASEQAVIDEEAHHKVAKACGYKFIFPFLSTSMRNLSRRIPAGLKKNKRLLHQLVIEAEMNLLSGFGGKREIQVPQPVRDLLGRVYGLRTLKKGRNISLTD